jgi:hypothetical protein
VNDDQHHGRRLGDEAERHRREAGHLKVVAREEGHRVLHGVVPDDEGQRRNH